MKFYLNNKEISKKTAIETLGKERFEKRVQEAKEVFYKDPQEDVSWMDGFRVEIAK